MARKEVEDILAEHADGLLGDQAQHGWLLSENQARAAELAPLFQLASALKAALTPVSAPAFKRELGQELVKYGPPVVVLGRSVSKRRARAWLAVAAAGSLISAAGVTALMLRRVRNVEKVNTQPVAS